MEGNVLTPSDKQQIVDEVSRKLVTQICNTIVKNEVFTSGLINVVTEKMQTAFNNDDANNKLRDTILGGIKQSFRFIKGGSILLYSILQDDTGKKLYIQLITEICNIAVEDPDVKNGTISTFINKVVHLLRDKDSRLFTNSPPQLGGKRKEYTLKRYSKKWSRTRKGARELNEKQNGGGPRLDIMRMYNKGSITRDEKDIQLRLVEITKNITDAISQSETEGATQTDDAKNKLAMWQAGKVLQEAKLAQIKNPSDSTNKQVVDAQKTADQLGYNDELLRGALLRGASYVWSGIKNTGKGLVKAVTKDIELSPDASDEAPNGMSEVAEDIMKEYDVNLLQKISARLDRTEGAIYQKILDSIYNNIQQNPEPILKSLVAILTNANVTNGLNGASTKVLLCSCLYNSSVTFGNAITDAYTKLIPADEKTFIPGPIGDQIGILTSDSFIEAFTNNLITKLQGRVFE